MVPRAFLVSPTAVKYAMKIIAVLLLAFSFSSFAAQEIPYPAGECKEHAPYGFPRAITKKKQKVEICRKGYYTVYDESAKIPAVVSYVLTPQEAVGCISRTNNFSSDLSLLPDAAATVRDYAKSGYDMGHIASASDMAWDEEVQRESFILSNVAPQRPEFNRGIWKKLEDTTRGWVISRNNPVLIYAGPIYTRANDAMIGPGFVTVPNGYYKILVDTVTREAQVFRFKHEGSTAPLTSFITSLAEVQKQTGLKFPMPRRAKWNGVWPIELKTARTAKAAVCNN